MAGKSVLLVGLCVGWIGALLASVLMIHMIVEDVNLKIPEAQQFGYTDWYVGKMGKLKKNIAGLTPRAGSYRCSTSVPL